MLRIDVIDEPESASLTLAGKLKGQWVRELEKCWQSAISDDPRHSVIVNLAAVNFIDSDGKELLGRMHRNGARLVATGCLMKAIVAEIEAEVGLPDHRGEERP
jgi:anti-anti-sigma regulatory factor